VRNPNSSNSNSTIDTSMLSRTLKHSRSAPSLRALSPGPQRQIAHIHNTPSVNAAKNPARAPAGGVLAKGWREKTVVELKAELKRRGLPTSGRKEEVLPHNGTVNHIACDEIDQCQCKFWNSRGTRGDK
jgi:hypothetical protein